MITENSCSGCGLCVHVCKYGAITIEKDNEGFRYPHIDEERCVNCSLCHKICPANKKYRREEEAKIDAYAGYSKDDDVLLNSTSGGVAYEMAYQFIKSGGVVFGVAFTENYRSAKYECISELESVCRLRKSKYIETDRSELFCRLPNELKKGRVLVIGLPCDIAAIKSLCGDNGNLYTCKLICKSVTSEKVLNQYMDDEEKLCGKKITKFDFRHKEKGESFFPAKVKIDFADGESVVYDYTATDFYKAFFILTRKDCTECLYKGTTNLADVTIGDFQGISPTVSYYNKSGVSLICTHSEKGRELISSLQNFEISEVPYKEVAGYNWMMNSAIPESPFREDFASKFVASGLHNACLEIKKNQIRILEECKKRLSKDKGVKIAVWGAGDTANMFFDYLGMQDWNVIEVYDSSYLRIGKRFRGKEVKNICEIDKSEADVLIVLIPSENEQRLDNQVRALGWTKEIMYVGKYKYFK